MSGIRTAVLTLVFDKVLKNRDGYINAQADFLYNYWDKANQEAIDTTFPIGLSVGQENANAYLVLAKATIGDLITVRGEITIGSGKDENGNYIVDKLIIELKPIERSKEKEDS